MNWQPISEAPKDGHNVLICHEWMGDRYYTECWWDYDQWMRADNKELDGEPTHFCEIIPPLESR